MLADGYRSSAEQVDAAGDVAVERGADHETVEAWRQLRREALPHLVWVAPVDEVVGNPDAQHALLPDALAMVADGRLSPAEPTTYPFDRVAGALDDLVERRAVGKLALVP